MTSTEGWTGLDTRHAMQRDQERAAVLALGTENCSIAGTLEALGDRWSILVLRELFFGVHRFNELQRDLGISRSVLTDRLARLVALGVVRVTPYQEPGDRSRHEYRLTRKGVDLLPVMMSLMSWGDRHLNINSSGGGADGGDGNGDGAEGGGGPITLHDRVSGETVRLEMRTPSGRIVAPNEMEPRARR
jgi:DNA-binding HxlR family transcriptional regulator